MCLNEPPRISLPAFTNQNIAGKLPGVVYNRAVQCEFLFGKGYRGFGASFFFRHVLYCV